MELIGQQNLLKVVIYNVSHKTLVKVVGF